MALCFLLSANAFATDGISPQSTKQKATDSSKKNSEGNARWVTLDVKGDDLCYTWIDERQLAQTVCRSAYSVRQSAVQRGTTRSVCMSFQVLDEDRIRMNRECAISFLNIAIRVEQIARVKRSATRVRVINVKRDAPPASPLGEEDPIYTRLRDPQSPRS